MSQLPISGLSIEVYNVLLDWLAQKKNTCKAKDWSSKGIWLASWLALLHIANAIGHSKKFRQHQLTDLSVAKTSTLTNWIKCFDPFPPQCKPISQGAKIFKMLPVKMFFFSRKILLAEQWSYYKLMGKKIMGLPIPRCSLPSSVIQCTMKFLKCRFFSKILNKYERAG